MTTNLKYRGWEFEVDKEFTKETYAQVTASGTKTCTCNNCKNFAAYRDNIYPEEVKKLFLDLGIDINKEAEISHYGKVNNEKHMFSGWFHFKGRIIQGENLFMEINPNFTIGFSKNYHCAFFDDKNDLVQIEFTTHIPWVIDKELETE